MTRTLLGLAAALALASTVSAIANGQGTTSSLSGSVSDETGAVIQGAQIAIKNVASGIEYKATSADNGTFSIPALDAGIYAVTVSARGFKQSVITDVKLDAGTPASIRVSLEVGSTSETVVVQGGAEIVQTQSANISTTLSVNQIANLPLVSRDTLNFVVMLPGVSTPGVNRDSTINGLPQSAINITIDGINSQDNYLKTSDGFFSRISPRLDSVEEVTVSTATPGAESGGQGAVQIKFVTRRGNNEFHGSLYEYHRNPALNSNYWFNNRDLPQLHTDTGLECGTAAQPGFDADKCKAQRDRVLLNQYGFRVGGPFLFPKKIFGPASFDGRNRAFFFVNYEEFKLPSQVTRNRTILNADARNGIFSYNSSTGIRKVDPLALATRNNQLATIDPTVGKLLSDIDSATRLSGRVESLGDPVTLRHTFTNGSDAKRYFPTIRLDFNLTDAHHLEVVYNYQKFDSSPDILNSRDPAFPGFPNQGGQISNRYAGSLALRSTLTPTIVNEARVGISGGPTLFNPTASLDQFTGAIANQDGFNINMNGAIGITNPTVINTPSRRNPVLWDISDNVTWTRGAHSLTFGGQFTQVNLFLQNSTIAPTIGFGTNVNDPANGMFVQANFQGASGTDITRAGNLYAVLTGRVISVTGNALLNEDTNTYKYLGDRNQRGRQREFGFFVQDSWRFRPSLTLSYGLRWELQLPFTPMNDSYTTTSVAGLYGISGEGNLFKPGVTPGSVTQFVQFKKGEKAYNTDYRNFAPSFGFAWTPNFSNGWLKSIAGENGQTVIRGGYSIAYNRNGIADYSDIYSLNPGSFVNADRSLTIGNLVSNNNQLPVLFRDKSRLGPGSFPSAPSYPLIGAVTDGANIIDPNIRIPYSQSWTFGIQREINKDTAIEVRYVGTRNLKGWSDYNFNAVEQNLYENGALNEFKLAQANLQANIAANRGNTFRYFGPGTGTSPLPITLAYFSGATAAQAQDPSRYTSANFTSTTFTNQLATHNPLPLTYAANLHSDATRRSNALRAGLAPNFFLTNPDLRGGVALTSNSGYTRYDSLQVELRRRLSRGLLVQGSYVWGKAFVSSRVSFRVPRINTLDAGSPGYVAHAFKLNWVYELPIGRGKSLGGDFGKVTDALLGGWEFHGTGRVQSGQLYDYGNVRLVGMTRDELQELYRVRFDDPAGIAYILPQDVIENTIRAFSTSPTVAGGYTQGAPTGRYIAPPNSASCVQVITGDCAPVQTVVTGPKFVRFDLSAVKRFKITENVNFELRGEFLNAFNNINFFGTVANLGGAQVAQFGQVTAAYRDSSNTQDPGGRLIQIVARINF